MIKVIVNGANGRMGQEVAKAVTEDAGLELVGKTDIKDDLAKVIKSSKAQVVVDFTTPLAVFKNSLTIMDAGAHPVIGTTGMSAEQIADLHKHAKRKKIGGIIAPNFSVGAVLMMKYAKDAARYFPNVEIIEMHHDKKLDAPSGTALKTAEMISENRKITPADKTEHETLAGARGGRLHDISIHSVRLPGYVAHQMVIFGGTSESLTIRHDSIHREAFMPGVILACKKVVALKEMYYGLESILD